MVKNFPDDARLSKISSEFESGRLEESFLRFSWNENKTITRNVLGVVGFLCLLFFVRDVLETDERRLVFHLMLMRLFIGAVVLGSAYYIHRSREYFSGYHLLLLFNQMLIAVGIFALAIMRSMFFAYLGVNTVLFTLIFYQFINNRFYFTVFACAYLGLGSIVTSLLFLEMSFSDLLGSLFFLFPINFLGILILRSINKIRRHDYLTYIQLKKSNEDKKELIESLQASLDEVKVLRGFLPICANCKKIRDDDGYWNRIESYIEKHSQVEFSHGLCPQCYKDLYKDEKWYKEPSGE